MMENVFWLGGSPCAGKSSISQILENDFDINVYRVDAAFENHRENFDESLHPALCRWESSTWNQRWMQPIENLVRDVTRCYREHFSLIMEDVTAFPRNKPLMVEGTALMPQEVFRILPERNNAIWLIPTPEFQRKYYSQREWIYEILKQCDNKEAAFQNWMERDAAFADFVANEAERLSLEWLLVDESKTVEENAAIVAGHFKF
ncbi:MAG: hypothetical protein ABWZ66_00590 [Pyrinomonadaceae bacterium]